MSNRKNVYENLHLEQYFVWKQKLDNLEEREKKSLEAAETWFQQRINRTGWTEHNNNNKVLGDVQEKRALIKQLLKRK